MAIWKLRSPLALKEGSSRYGIPNLLIVFADYALDRNLHSIIQYNYIVYFNFKKFIMTPLLKLVHKSELVRRLSGCLSVHLFTFHFLICSPE